jgi:hypothetical protein
LPTEQKPARLHNNSDCSAPRDLSCAV